MAILGMMAVEVNKSRMSVVAQMCISLEQYDSTCLSLLHQHLQQIVWSGIPSGQSFIHGKGASFSHGPAAVPSRSMHLLIGTEWL